VGELLLHLGLQAVVVAVSIGGCITATMAEIREWNMVIRRVASGTIL